MRDSHLPLTSVVPARCFSPSPRWDCPREGRGRLSLNRECLVTVCGACKLVESPAFTLVSIVLSQISDHLPFHACWAWLTPPAPCPFHLSCST